MAELPGTLREVAWRDLFPWLSLLRTFRQAKGISKLFLATLAILLSSGWWWLLGALFENSTDQRLQIARTEVFGRLAWQPGGPESPSDGLAPLVRRTGTWLGGEETLGPEALDWLCREPVLGTWQQISRPFWYLFDVRYSYVGTAYLLLGALGTLAIWALFGGAITRIAAVEFAQERRLSIRQAFRHAFAKWPSYFGAPLFPLVGVLICVALLAGAGWMWRTDVGTLIVAILSPLLLILGVLMSLVAVGLVVGWPLMFAAVSAEGSDVFDALSRSYSYVLDRPHHYLGYALVSVLAGIGGWLVAAIFAWLVVYLTVWGMSWSAGGEATDRLMSEVAAVAPEATTIPWLGPSESAAAPARSLTGEMGLVLVAIVFGLVKVVALAFGHSFFWCSTTSIYFLLRRDVDAMELDEVHLDEQDEAYALPPLRPSESGVPEVDDSPEG